MKRISYAGGSFVTGDLIADAVLDYAAVLARAGQADRVTVPGLGGDDRLTEFDLVVGPASQLVAEAVEFGGDELESRELLDDLRVRERRARAGRIGEPEYGDGV